MIDQDWERVDFLLSNWWGQEWTQGASKAYRMALGRFAPEQVVAVLTACLEAGGDFRPSAAVLVSAILKRTVTPHPTFEEAYALCERVWGPLACSRYDKRFGDQYRKAIRLIADESVVVAGWAARRGLCQAVGSILSMPVNDPEYGHITVREMHRDFNEALNAAREREARGLPAVDPELIAGALPPGEAGAADNPMADLLERLRPAAQIAQESQA